MFFEFFSRRGMNKKLLNIGVEGGYRFELGTREELHEIVGIGPNVVLTNVREFLLAL